jgi:hypothetical protein
MERASAELARIQPTANADSRALARYLSVIGVDATPERLNDLLTLLAVLMVEAGGGLSLAIGMALFSPPGRATAAAPDTMVVPPQRARTPTVITPDALTNAVSVRAEQHVRTCAASLTPIH